MYQLTVQGAEPAELYAAVPKLEARLRAMPALMEVTTDLLIRSPQLNVRIDRDKAADLGVNVQDIASTLNVLVGGQEVTSYMEGGEQYEVHVRAEPGDRRDRQGIEQAEVPTSMGSRVALRDLVTLQEGEGPSLVNRIARRRQVLLYANMQPGHSSQTVIDALAS